MSQKPTHNAEINGMTVAHAAGQIPYAAVHSSAFCGGISASRAPASGMMAGYERVYGAPAYEDRLFGESGQESISKYASAQEWKGSEILKAEGSKNSRWVDQKTISDTSLSLVSKLPEKSPPSPMHS